MIRIDGKRLLKHSIYFLAFALVYAIADYQVAKHTGLEPNINFTNTIEDGDFR
tara:strand:+ start:109 stop:267 length:159 start_codon:yes stop_codon:yes gene_type:complete